jgi:abortive infection bacteriophage resistance protein
MVSWLRTLLFVRNACAHHARLWNREIPVRPYIPKIKHSPEWHSPVQFDATSIFTVLALLNYLLKYIRPQNDFRERLETLLEKYQGIPRDEMGFPENWKDSPIWQ